ncbi:MAG: SaoD/DsrE family protein [Gammaproteobacteria bacterium]|jgi:sulfur relay (sulfurtransferase) complex TusBCD TusD component (DsrE family)|nr:SaoD/DsrE family protein [Gammaproteobacteria bacterium]MDG1951246.1 SaoD/DsrE family protein [Gammaproteobacteria bacterium]MDG2118213.1 SaoD/DsrE family protein [Gammaproteobacteria bacterium]|tara:strand:+ start:131 stop:508 length:378 start_codon:yes stop_codon:yes gene_type:complete
MKVAYIFRNDMSATFQLASMILPQLEQDNHGVDVAGMMFFDDNVYSLSAGNEIGQRLSIVAKKNNILLMICDQCALRRGMATGDFSQCGTGEVAAKNTVDGVIAGCFPQLYGALSANMPDQIITL